MSGGVRGRRQKPSPTRSNQLRYTREENISCVGGGIYPNMLCAHPPFQIDGNFGFAAAVAEMLIQSGKGHFLLLPALPDEWKDGKVGGMKAQGDITVDFEWREGRIHRVRLCSSREQKVTPHPYAQTGIPCLTLFHRFAHIFLPLRA